jgi:hypothetical protein
LSYELQNDHAINFPKQTAIRFYDAYVPLLALSESNPHFYDLLLTDTNLHDSNGFQLSEMILVITDNDRD